ncbi:MAG: hypothetical protein JJ891_07930 [Rhizobiaceae bacterium]|jgi:flagellar basal body-associated protein FliL|nr:hypothetical protein [Rhizobiaceae bacterium]
MIKLLLTGIWGVILLSGSIYFFSGMPEPQAGDGGPDGKPYFGKLETIHLDTMSVAFIQKNAVQGYVILDVAFAVDSARNKKLSVPAKLIVQNEVNNAFLKNRRLNINRLDEFDPDKLEQQLADQINEKVGELLVSEVMIQRIDFLSSEEVRDTKLRGG